MTYVEISKESLVTAAEAAGSKLHHYERMADDNRLGASIEAHARTLDAFEAFKCEVSDAVEAVFFCNSAGSYEEAGLANERLRKFIIKPPVDPLVEALQNWGECEYGSVEANALRAAIEARGGKIVWEGE